MKTIHALNYNDINKEFLLGFWGTRGSIPTPGRVTEKYGGNTSCVEASHGNNILIFDAGTGIRNLGIDIQKKYINLKKKVFIHIFLSHTHWDHIQGFPFFTPAYIPGVDITVYGTATEGKFILENILRGQMDSNYFPVSMSALNSDIKIIELTGKPVTIGNYQISYHECIHPGGSIAYKVSSDRRSLIYATDNELDQFALYKQEYGEKHQLEESFSNFIRNADIMVGDGQYTEEEYKTKATFGHASIPFLLETAYKARVKRIAVFHHEPQHTDKFIDKISLPYVEHYRKLSPPMDVFWAREGMYIDV